jgi:hypothetical protein
MFKVLAEGDRNALTEYRADDERWLAGHESDGAARQGR